MTDITEQGRYPPRGWVVPKEFDRLSARTIRCLYVLNINNLDELRARLHEVVTMRGVGDRTVREIIRVLRSSEHRGGEP